jgi:hypothetical protein
MSVAPSAVDAVALYALKNYTEKPNWVNITQIAHEYVWGNRFFKSKQEMEDGGQALAWMVQKSAYDNFAYTQLFDDDTTHSQNNGVEAKVDWSGQKSSWQYDVNEPQLQGSATRIVNVLKERESEMWGKWFENMETALWTCPVVGTVPQELLGIPYWVVKNSSSTPGFNGAAPSGYSDVANISPTTYPAWKNWTFTYAASGGITRTDFVRKTLQAMEWTNFKAPMGVVGVDTAANVASNWGLYTTYTPYQTLKELQEQRNDNLGSDVGYMNGRLTIRGTPVEWVSALDGGSDGTLASVDTQNPIYGINWKWMRYKVLKGRDRVRTGPIMKAGSHNVRVVFVDNWGQYQHLNRRTSFVGYGA